MQVKKHSLAALRQLSPSVKAASQVTQGDLFSTVRVWHMVLHFLEVLKSLTTSLFLNSFYKRHRNELRYAFYSPLSPQKRKLQEKSHYYKKAPWNQVVKKTVSILQLRVQLRLFTVKASDDFAQDITILQHTAQAHALVHWNKRSYTMQSWFQLLKNT